MQIPAAERSKNERRDWRKRYRGRSRRTSLIKREIWRDREKLVDSDSDLLGVATCRGGQQMTPTIANSGNRLTLCGTEDAV